MRLEIWCLALLALAGPPVLLAGDSTPPFAEVSIAELAGGGSISGLSPAIGTVAISREQADNAARQWWGRGEAITPRETVLETVTFSGPLSPCICWVIVSRPWSGTAGLPVMIGAPGKHPPPLEGPVQYDVYLVDATSGLFMGSEQSIGPAP